MNITQKPKHTVSTPTRPNRATSKKQVSISLIAALFALLYGASPGMAATVAPDLGAAQRFAVLARTAVTCTDSTITGDVGVYPGTVTETRSIIEGTIDLAAQAANEDFVNSYVALALTPCDLVVTGSLAGLTLSPGTYCLDAAVAEAGGVLTLRGDSNGVWLIKVGTLGTGALTAADFSVVMADGGQATNVYWWVAEAATLTDSNFRGTILAGSSITVTRGSLDGKALAGTAVTLTGASLAAPTPTPAPTPTNQAPVDLRSAGSFVILSKSGITDVPTSAITGDVGTSPITGAAMTGLDCAEVTGTIYTVDAAGPACRVENAVLLTAAVSDMETAYADAAGRTLPDATELGAGNIDGMTLAPGLYKWSSSVLVPTRVTLTGGTNDVWIFQIAQGLTVGNGAMVTLSGGAQAKNIFWQVAGQTTLGTTANFKGIILCQTAIVLNTGATLEGRALAQTAVTLQMNAVTGPN